MKNKIIKKCLIKEDNVFNVDDINFSTESSIISQEDLGVLSIDFDLENLEVSIKENDIAEIISIIGKIDKYQKGKMSEKESLKMIKKLDLYPSLSTLVDSIRSQKVLDDNQIQLLNLSKVKAEYVVDIKLNNIVINTILLNEKEISIIKDSEEFCEMIIRDCNSRMLEDNFQKSLEFIYDEKEAERIAEMMIKIKSIMGGGEGLTKPKKKNNTNEVDDYLKEKQKLIEENADTNYYVDIEFPLPQANNLSRIIQLGNEIFARGGAKINLETLENDLDKRDVHYYSRALCYLGLAKLDSSSRDLCLTYAGDNFFNGNTEEKKDIIFSILNTDPLVRKVINNELDLTTEKDKKLFESRGISADSTIQRRISSLKSWIDYLSS
jgi:hypothetical protein